MKRLILAGMLALVLAGCGGSKPASERRRARKAGKIIVDQLIAARDELFNATQAATRKEDWAAYCRRSTTCAPSWHSRSPLRRDCGVRAGIARVVARVTVSRNPGPMRRHANP